MQFNRLDKNSLLTYISSEGFDMAKDIAITKHRALSQIQNPRLLEGDILLITVTDGDQLAGYVGVLPDDLHVEGNQIHFGWLSALWVNPNYRGRGFGKKLIDEALICWDGKILSADYVLETKILYDKTGQFQSHPFVKEGARLYLKSDLKSLLPPKGFPFNKLPRFLGFLDVGLNFFIWFKRSKRKSLSENFKLELVEEIDDEINQFILKHQQDEVTKRTKSEFNWMLRNPWLIPVSEDDNSHKYHFTSSADVFENKVVRVLDSSKELCAVMIFSIRNQSCKLLYVYHQHCIELVADAIDQLLLEWDVATFTCFYAELGELLLNKKSSAILTRKMTRNYMVSNKFGGILNLDQNSFQGGDGDVGFT